MATNNQVVKIEPSILVWARETLGMSITEVANKLDKDRETVKQWEIGKTTPSLAQLEKLAYTIYKRPLAVFFLPKPPKESTAKQDFRTLPDKEIANLSPANYVITPSLAGAAFSPPQSSVTITNSNIFNQNFNAINR